ncbi:copper resistance CopC/CopD family protein [Nocardioides turkmenicus]|nr:copper resistance protein CopC [Nocardioides sp. KC13]
MLGVVLAAGPTEAHAVLKSSTPAEGDVLDVAPTEVTLIFNEPVNMVPESVQVFAPDGTRVEHGKAAHPDGTANAVRIGVASSQRGTYLVSWRVVSADSHPLAGAFTFSVGAASKTDAKPPAQPSQVLSWSLGGARWLGYLGSALLLGILVVLAWCWPTGSATTLQRLVSAGAVLLAGGALLEILLKGPYDAGLGLSVIGRPDLLQEVWQTTYGKAVVARFLLTGLGVLVIWRNRWVISIWALLVGMTFALAGHAAGGSLRVFAVLSETAHAIAASIWLGGLLVVLVAIRLRDAEALAVVRRFSRLAFAAVCALVITGLFQSWRGVGWSWGALTETTYGHELLVKTMLVVAVLLLASFSRAWVNRRIAGSSAPARRGIDLRWTVLGEAVGIIVVLAVTSSLTATEPARTAYHPKTTAELVIEGDTVRVAATPRGDRSVDLRLYVFDASGQPTDPPEVKAAVSLGKIGPLPVPLEAVSSGQRLGSIDVPVAGTWKLAITVRATEFDQSTKTIDVPIR